MSQFRISNQFSQQYVTLPASFITRTMPSMKGDYLKLYLYLVYLTQSRELFALPKLADLFECGERDLLRGLTYLKREGLILMETDEQGEPVSLTLLPVVSGAEAFPEDEEDLDSSESSTAASERRSSVASESSSSASSKRSSSAGESRNASSEGRTGSSEGRNASSEGRTSASGTRFSKKLPEMPSGSQTEGTKASYESTASTKESHTPVMPYETYVTQNENGWGTVSSARGEAEDSSSIHAVITGHAGSTSPLKLTPAPDADPASKPHLLQEPDDPEEVSLVIKLVEGLLQRTLSMREAEKITDYYMMLDQNLDLIVCLFEYCIDQKGRGVPFNYLDVVARDWKLKGYKSDREVKEINARTKKDQARKEYELVIRRHLGIREILPVHEKFVNRWRDEWKIPQEVLIPVLDTAAKNAGSPIDYADSILQTFYEKNIRTAEQARRELDAFNASYHAAGEATSRPKKTSMHNFTERRESEDAFNDLISIPLPGNGNSGEK